MEKLNTIKIGNKAYPVKVDLNVLEELQKEFGSVNAFELELLGLEVVRDSEGAIEYLDSGEPKMRFKEASIRAIKTILPLMINEGLEIDAEQKHKEFEPVTANEIIRNCGIPFQELAKIIHSEYKRCFVTKK